MSWRTWAVFATVGLLWGSAWILTPLLPQPELLTGALRFAIAAVLLAIAALMMRARQTPPTRAFRLVPSLLLGVTMAGLPYALAVWAKDAVSPGLIAVLYSAMPLLALFFNRGSGDRGSVGRGSSAAPIPAMAIGVGGIAFLVDQGIDTSPAQLRGLFLLAAAVTLGAFSLNYAKKNVPRGSFLFSSAIQYAVASVLLVFVGGIRGHQPVQINRNAFLALFALAAIESAVALPLVFWLLVRIEAWQAAMLQWFSTLCAVAEAAWFLRARPSFEMGAGAAMVMAAMLWLMRPGGSGADTGTEAETVTLQITRRTQTLPDASDSYKEGVKLAGDERIDVHRR